MIKPSDIPEFIRAEDLGSLVRATEFGVFVQPQTRSALRELAKQMVDAGMTDELAPADVEAVRYAIEVGIAALRAADML